VQHGHVTLADIKSANFTDNELETLRLEKGDILVIRSNGSLDLVGRSAVVHEAAVGMLFAGYLIRLRLDRIWLIRSSFSSICKQRKRGHGWSVSQNQPAAEIVVREEFKSH
jgi:hypothetical protein